VTVDYRTKSDMRFGDKYCFYNNALGQAVSIAGSTCATGAAAPGVGQNGFNFYTGRISATTFLANAYVDLGTWHGLTPYVGAGAGFANVRVDGLVDQGTNQVLASGATFPVAPAYYTSKSKTNFAWAAMAGVAYDVSDRLKLELGYRYIYMGDLKGIGACGNPTCGIIGATKIDAHEFRLGMRWMLGGPTFASAPMAYPPQYVQKKF
jgi:opacity protein-like surface antigen